MTGTTRTRTTDRPADARPLTGRQLAAAVGVLLLLALVLPPLIAVRVNARRVQRARAEAQHLAVQIRTRTRQGETASALAAGIFVGNGAVPQFVPGAGWEQGSIGSLDAVIGTQTAPDPWGNRWFVRVDRGGHGGAVLVISAGPNGILETAFTASDDVLAGDDVGARGR